MSVDARDAAVRAFAAAPPRSADRGGPPPNVMLVSLMAGAHGLNLACANVVVMVEPWYNPQLERQAVDRTHRIGQTRPVEVVRLVMADSVEDSVVRVQEGKSHLFREALSPGLEPRTRAPGETS